MTYKNLFFVIFIYSLLLLNSTLFGAKLAIPLNPPEALNYLMTNAVKESETSIKVILVSTGSYNPVHRMHLGMFDAAKDFLEKQNTGAGNHFHVILGLMSPSHDKYVRDKMESVTGNTSNAISFEDRSYMCKLAVQAHDNESNGKKLPIRVHEWEGQQTKFVNFPAVTAHIREEINEAIQKNFQSQKNNVLVLYLCGMDHYKKCGLKNDENVIALDRNTNSHEKRDTTKHNYIAPAGVFEDLSSTNMRKRRDAKETVTDLTFESVAKYLQDRLGWENAAKPTGQIQKLQHAFSTLKSSLETLNSKLSMLIQSN